MDSAAARRILGVSEDASFEQIRTRFRTLAKTYHPDIPFTGDARHFSLIATAFVFLQRDDVGWKHDDAFSDDVSYAMNLRAELSAFFDGTLHDFCRGVRTVQRRTRASIGEAIEAARSVDDLKRVLNGSVKLRLADAATEIASDLRALEKKITRPDGEFIFRLFREMYRTQRRLWLLDLYKNPVAVTQAVGMGLIFFLRHYPIEYSPVSALRAIASLWWLPFLFGAIGLGVIAIQFFELDPRRQFVPPRISVGGLLMMTSDAVRSIGLTSQDLAVGGAFVGAMLGTAILPGIGTIIGAIVGACCGMGGETLEQMKSRVYGSVMREFDAGVEQVLDRVTEWASRASRDLHDAAIQSFALNGRKLARLPSERSRLALPRNAGRAGQPRALSARRALGR